jgi:hypothetical protein
MGKIIKVVLLVVLLGFTSSISLLAQSLWQRARIYCAPESRSLLASTGIAIDHPVESNKRWITADLSDQEIQLARAAGFTVEILIPDLKAWFIEMNETSPKQSFKTSSLPIPPGFNLGSMGGYITYSELLLEMDSMVQNFPNLISAADSIGTSYEGRTIWAYRVSDNPNTDENEPEVLYTSMHHAREPNAMMQMLYYLYYLLNNYGTDPEVTCLLDNKELYFVPIVNPDGYVYNETTDPQGGGMWRKNRRDNLDGTFGVDLNRNYGENWGFDNVGSSPNSSSDTYRGTAGFSEPETQAIRNYCNSREFRSALNYHTFGNLLIYPYGYIPFLLTPDSMTFSLHAQELTSINNYKYGTGVETVGYVTNGDSDDWMYSEQSTKDKIISMTPEAGTPNFGFWPPQNQIIPFCEDNLRANLIQAWLADAFFKASYADLHPIQNPTAWLPVEFINLGLDTAATVSATLEIIDANILSVANTIQFNVLPSLGTKLDSFQVSLANAIPEGTLIRAVVHTRFVSCFDKTDTISFYYGTPVQVYTSNFENGIGSWTSGSGWALTTEDANSPVNSMTDSPNSNYQDNDFTQLSLNQTFTLSGMVAPRLEFFARWRIEAGYDYCQLKISANLGPWTALSTTRSIIGSSDQVIQPLYDGSKPWGKETADLTPYLGKSVRFRFELTSDPFQNDEGFFFDDFTIVSYNGPNQNHDFIHPKFLFSIYPNPAVDFVVVDWPQDQIKSENTEFALFDFSGKLVLKKTIQKGELISLLQFPAGLYSYQIKSEELFLCTGKLIKTNN